MTTWTVAYQAFPPLGFSRQEYWSRLPFPSSRDIPDPGIEPRSPALQADALPSEPPGKPKDMVHIYNYLAIKYIIQPFVMLILGNKSIGVVFYQHNATEKP